MRLLIYGVVQGVGFRPAVYRVARKMGLGGFVRNNGSNVEVVIGGDHEAFIRKLKEELPPLARMDRVDVLEEGDEKADGFLEFTILESRKGQRLSPIPPDTAVCADCLAELFSEGDRRYRYPFTNCTNCGARYSIIEDLPYDRDKTAMEPFLLCDRCLVEYKNPENRRFHAQTISCPDDGPGFSLHLGKEQMETDAPLPDFAGHIATGKLGILKGWSGMHIVCRLDRIPQLREWYGRPNKPFAVMVKNLEAAKRYGMIDENSRKHLESPQRPIVLVKKSRVDGGSVNEMHEVSAGQVEFLEMAAPGLAHIGLFLPYTGMHHLLFHFMERAGKAQDLDVLVMTSANRKGEPMITDNLKALELGLDVALLHNRRIINRLDDSLVKPGPFGDGAFFIRRSRGYVPIPLNVAYDARVLSVGAERNINASVSTSGKLYTSQYVGNSTYYDVLRFFKDAAGRLAGLLGIDGLDAVGMDLHPQYPTRRLAMEYAKEHGADAKEVQHHWAHAASLMADNGISEPVIALAVDGTGYGADGTIWGGEVLYSTFEDFERVAHLEPLPLLGGDKAVLDPKRLAFAVAEKLGHDTNYFDENTEEIFRKMLPKSVVSSGMGRTLDALSCMLGICMESTYDGEPAMRLEKYLAQDRATLGFKAESDGGVISVMPLFDRVMREMGTREKLSEAGRARLASSFVFALTDEMTRCAIEAAHDRGLGHVGITGGVAYSLPIVRRVGELVKDAGLNFLAHREIPCGDGGISAGQNVIVGNGLN